MKKSNPEAEADEVEFVKWFERNREHYTVKGIALLFNVTPRTVQNWLADGLDCHMLYGESECQACAKYPNESGSGNMRWGLHPLAVLEWLIIRKATPEPGLIKLIRKRAVEVYAWNRKHGFPGCNAAPPKAFSWAFYGEQARLIGFMAWFWTAYIVNPSKGEIPLEDNPFVWVHE